MQVGKSTEQRDDLLARFRAALGIVTLTIVVVALTGGFLVTRTAVLPIRRLTQTVASIIRTGRTDARVPVAGNAGEGKQEGPGSTDAIDELTMLFNAMLDKIEGLVTGMRGALDNVSHDLRTPLTHLRGAAEMALAGPPDPERYREALADCVEEADRVLVMLNTLMDISEAESGAMQLKREPIRLADIVARAVELYRDVAEAKGVSIDVRLKPDATTGEEIGAYVASGFSRTSGDVVVMADRTRMEQVAANLIDNAVKYTPAGGRVEVTVRREGDQAVVACSRHRRRHSRRRVAADLGPALPGRHQPNRARPRAGPQPCPGDCSGARRDGRRRQANPASARRSPSGFLSRSEDCTGPGA